MNDRVDIEAILDQFRDWLETAHEQADELEEVDTGPVPRMGPAQEFGIINLVEEFTALRHELKLQTKSGRGLIEQTDSTIAALRQAIDQFRSVEPREAQAVWTAAKGLAEALADLDEALVRGEREIDRARRQIADSRSASSKPRDRSFPRTIVDPSSFLAPVPSSSHRNGSPRRPCTP